MVTLQARRDELAELVRCPVCRCDLECRDGQWHCQNIGCGRVYPATDGIPILLDASSSVFDAEMFQLRQATFFKPRSRLRAMVSRCLPTGDLNLVAPRVLGQMRDRLVAASRRPRVLVLGGGVLGCGMEVFTADPRIMLVETDVSLEARTQLVCDAHDLPFADECFDGLVVQATLEHVLDPQRCVAEIERVLKPGGLVYADTPFMQQVHGREYDFTRFTRLGHRRLLRQFEELESGISVGPGSALAWSARYFLLSFFVSQPARRVASGLARLALGWLKYFDYFLANRPGSLDAAAAFYFLGRKSAVALDDRDLLTQYRGGF